MGILEEGREKATEETFERKMTKNFPKLMLDKTNKQTDLISSENTLRVIMYTFINVPL